MNTENVILSVSFLELENLFKRKTDAITPRIIENVFGEKISLDYPAIFSADRFTELHDKGLGLMTFISKSAKEVTKQVNYRQQNGKDFFFSLSEIKNASCWLEEKPRPGLCLIGMSCIPNSFGKNFIDQTYALVAYAEEILPELIATDFWKHSKLELNEAEKKAKELIQVNKIKEVTRLFQQLQINRYFRPQFGEFIQFTTAYNYQNNVRLYEKVFSWTNSSPQSDWGLIYAGEFEDIGMHLSTREPDSPYSSIGCSFICSLDWLQSII